MSANRFVKEVGEMKLKVPTGSLTSDCAKVKAYIAKKYWLKILTKGIKPFSGCGHL